MVRRSVLPALVPALAAATALLLAAPAPPSEATALPPTTAPTTAPAAAGAPDRYDPALAVTIDTMTPAALPEEGPIRLTGSVTNLDDVPWTTVNLYSFLDDAPMTTATELADAARSNPLLAVGERITVESASDSVGDLEPGETARYSLTVARDLLRVGDEGVYWFGVHAMGESAEQPRDDVADGRARTFLPYRAPASKGSLKTALVLPLRRYLPHAADGSLDELDRLRRTLSKDGRLRDLVDFAASAGDLPLSLLVDPALPDAVRRLAEGNPPRSLAPTETPPEDQDPGAPPSDGATGSAEASPVPSESPTEEGSEPPTESEAQAETETAEAATGWLGRFEEAVDGSEVLTLPYGDLDVPAAAALAPSVYDLARGRPGPRALRADRPAGTGRRPARRRRSQRLPRRGRVRPARARCGGPAHRCGVRRRGTRRRPRRRAPGGRHLLRRGARRTRPR